MEEAKNHGCQLRIWLKSEPSLEGSHVVQCLVNDRQADDCIDDVAVDSYVEVHTEQHRRGVPESKQADIDANVLEAVQVEDDTKEEKNMVVARDHVLCAQINEGKNVDAGYLLDIPLVTLSHSMSERVGVQREQEN